jgi:hypothetical protein
VTVRPMSDGELTRLEVLRDLDQRRLTTEAAARLPRLERRQVFRLLKAYRSEGPAGLISKRRGRRSNRRKPEALRNAALAIIRECYWDFGPTLAAEMRCARAPRPTPVTSVNGRDGDICIWWTQRGCDRVGPLVVVRHRWSCTSSCILRRDEVLLIDSPKMRPRPR